MTLRQHLLLIAAFATAVVALGCSTELPQYESPGSSPSTQDVARPDAGRGEDERDIGAATTPDLGDHEPRGELLIDEVDLVVTVGEEVELNFSAVIYDADPEDTYITVTNAPFGAEVDPDGGWFYWIPTVDDIGIHALGIDLWYEADGLDRRVLDAQRVLIEVIPGNTDALIEVGI